MAFTALAHISQNHSYSAFHNSICDRTESSKNYALKHLYSLDNLKIILSGRGWSAADLKGVESRVIIDVFNKVVWVKVANFERKRGQKIKVRGLCSFISKNEFLKTLIDKCWSKADPYKLVPGDNWDEFIAKGTEASDFYEVQLGHETKCTCHAYSGISKAFAQDYYATKLLIQNDICQGQTPDKHVFAAWKTIGARNYQEFEYCYAERRERATDIQNDWDIDEFVKAFA
jgi:hypothetical protein